MCRGKSNVLFVFFFFNLGFFKCVKYEANFSVFFHQTSVKGKKPVGFTFLGQRVVRVHLFLGDFLTQTVEIMELRRVVTETVQRNFLF